jgi:hypothetical protein
VSTDPPLERDEEHQETPSDEANEKPFVGTEPPNPTGSNTEVSSAPDLTEAEDTSGDNTPAENVDDEPGTPENESTIEEAPGMSIMFSSLSRPLYASVHTAVSVGPIGL